MILDGKGKSFTFGGVTVGKVISYDFVDGETPDVIYRTLEDPNPEYIPALPNYGLLRLTLYRDLSDAGQTAMEVARANRSVVEGVLTFSDGSTRTFSVYVKSLPIVGSDDALEESVAVLRIASVVV